MKSLIKNEKGFTLIEVLVGLAIMAVIGTGFLMALATASKALIVADERTTAESLARNQMEYVKDLDYDVSYSVPIPAEYTDAGYSATIDVESLPDPNNPPDGLLVGIQKVIVTVYHHGNEVLILEDYKVEQ